MDMGMETTRIKRKNGINFFNLPMPNKKLRYHIMSEFFVL